MEIFKPSMENIGIIKNHLRYNRYFGCELTAANNILWSKFYDTSFVIVEDMLSYCKMEENKPVMFTFPVGKHNPKGAFDILCQEFENVALPLNLIWYTRRCFNRLKSGIRENSR